MLSGPNQEYTSGEITRSKTEDNSAKSRSAVKSDTPLFLASRQVHSATAEQRIKCRFKEPRSGSSSSTSEDQYEDSDFDSSPDTEFDGDEEQYTEIEED